MKPYIQTRVTSVPEVCAHVSCCCAECAIVVQEAQYYKKPIIIIIIPGFEHVWYCRCVAVVMAVVRLVVVA